MKPPSCLGRRRENWNRRRWLGAILGLTPALTLGEELRRLPPSAPTQEDPALRSLLDRMRGLIQKRDQRALTALMAPDFRVEFDVGKGPKAFLQHWRPSSEDSRVWDLLDRLLSLHGHYYSETLFVLPHVVAKYPIDLDPLEHVVAVREGVQLHAEPMPDSPVTATLDYDIIPLAKPLQIPVAIPSASFVEVVHPESGHCFVASNDVYSPAAHRAFFEKRNGRWRWISLAAATLADPPELTRARKPA